MTNAWTRLAYLAVAALAWIPAASAGESEIVAQWHFDEGAGIYARSAGPEGGTFALPKEVQWVDGKKGKAIYLDLTGGGPHGASLKLNLPEGGAVSVWVRPAFSSDSALALKASNVLMLTGGQGRFELGFIGLSAEGKPARTFTWRCLEEGKNWTNTYSITDRESTYGENEWEHWVGAWKRLPDGGYQMAFFIDGVSVGTTVIPAGRGPKGDFKDISISGWGWNLKGAIDELAIYDGPLSAEQVQALFSAP